MSGDKLYEWGTKSLDKTIKIDAEKSNLKVEDIMSVGPIAYEEKVKTGINADKELTGEIIEKGADVALEEMRGEVSRNMPGPAMIFSRRQSFIKDANYTYLTDKGERKKGERKEPSKKYMKPILDNLAALDDLLDKNVNPKEAKDIQNKYKDVILACEFYLKNRNPWSDEGKARKQMIQDFYDQLKVESMRFSLRVENIGKGDETEGKTWIDYLKDVRTQKFEDGVDGVTVTEGGAGTSKVYIVEKNGKKQYFKENEKMPSDSYKDLLLDEVRRLKEDYKDYVAEGHSKEENDAYYKKNKSKMIELQEITNSLLLIFKDGYDDISDFIDKYRTPDAMYQGILDILYANKKGNKKIEDTYSMLQKVKNIFWDVEVDYVDKRDAYNKAMAENASNVDELSKELKEIKKKRDDTEYVYLSETILDFSKKLRCQSIARNDAMIEKGDELSKRNVATARMARLLGINNTDSKLIAESSLADVTINGKYMQGIIMEEAPGKRLSDIEDDSKNDKKNTRYSPEVFRDLLTLQIFDIIVGQVDRNGSNYLGKSKLNEDFNYTEVTQIMGIDNDMCCGQLYYEDIRSRGSKGINRMRNIEKDGKLNIPGFDKEFAQAIKDITPERIHHELCDVLNEKERKALIDRINGVKKVILRQEEIERKRNKKKSSKKGSKKGSSKLNSKFISRENTEAWDGLMEKYATRVKEHMENNLKTAENYKLNEMAKLDAKMNLGIISEDEYDNEKAQIERDSRRKKMRTINEIKETTYLRAQYLVEVPSVN